MRQWMQEQGEKFREHRSEGPMYLSGSQYKPFPSNPLYVSEPVLSEDSREEIWRKVVKEGEAIKSVSANFGVDMRRVAAVVRLKEVEKAWERDVSIFLSFILSPNPTRTRLQVMIHQKIRLVLKTYPVVTKF
jgi:hypothetical protein